MVSAPGAIAAGATTAPAMLGVTWPGLYGTHEEIQVPVLTLPKTPLIVSSALYTFAPCGARPGVPVGTSEGGRQMTRNAGPSCVCGWGRRYIGTLSGIPSADPVSCHVAIGTLDPMQACWPVAT